MSKDTNNLVEQETLESLPVFVSQLIPNGTPQKFMEEDKQRFKVLEDELLTMRYEMADVPTTESLVKLYTAQAKGRAYYERSEEIFRQYLKYFSTVTLIVKKAHFAMEQVEQQATVWMRKNRPAEIKETKSGAERTALITAIIPQVLKEELFGWETLESSVKVNFSILKSYRDQFKSINDNVLVQLSIFKNLIMLGELSVDPEIVRAMRVIDTSFRPTQKDTEEKRQADSPIPELNIEEGTVTI